MSDIATIFYNQINTLTSSLIEVSLAVEQNFPSLKDGVITIKDKTDISISLKNIKYSAIYDELEKTKSFNVKLIDGGLIQMMYTFNKNDLIKYRLAFFPSYMLDAYQNSPDKYENDEIYADILLKSLMPTPIRFDYDPASSRELIHPISHLSIGHYTNCRIPVFGVITPNMFMDFILRNFYHTARNKFSKNLEFKLDKHLPDCILDKEKNILHLNVS